MSYSVCSQPLKSLELDTTLEFLTALNNFMASDTGSYAYLDKDDEILCFRM